MKKLLLTCAAAAICIGLNSTVTAGTTAWNEGSHQDGWGYDFGNTGCSGFSLTDWLYGNFSGCSSDGWGSGDGQDDWGCGGDGWDDDHDGWDWDDDNWGWDDNEWDCDDDGWHYKRWDRERACPIKPIPAPGAIPLCGIGALFIGWLRRRNTL